MTALTNPVVERLSKVTVASKFSVGDLLDLQALLSINKALVDALEEIVSMDGPVSGSGIIGPLHAAGIQQGLGYAADKARAALTIARGE
jgi:hypothetical protein